MIPPKSTDSYELRRQDDIQQKMEKLHKGLSYLPNLTYTEANTWFKRMFWNYVFFSILLYTNPSWARCAITHLRRAMFLSFDMKTVAKMICKPQHVGNISSDVPYMLTLSCRIGYCFYIKWQKRSAAWVRGDTSSSAWSCMSYNWKKYMIPKHAFEPGMTAPERGLYFYHI